jgi:hypothetical protein
MSVVLLTEPFSGGGGGSGTVTSVDVSGGTTGLTTSGGPITTSGTITLAGILAVANGGTGTATPGLVAGTNVTITGTWPNQTINASGGGSGTVTTVSVVSANGLAGTVANATTTPAITLSTTITGILKGNGTAISAATSGTDYQAPITLTTTGTSGAATFVGNTLNIPQYSGGGGSGTVTSVGQTFTGGLISVGGSPVTTSGTLALTVAGTSGGMVYFSSASAWASSAVLAASSLVIGGGAGAAPSTITTGTGVVSALGVTTNAASGIVVKDSSGNISTNATFNGFTSVAASGTTITLTAASTPVYSITGSGGQVIQLPNATTLPNGAIFSFNNNQSSGAITVNNASATLVVSVPSGAYVTVVLLSNATSAGTWDRHDQTPSNVSWSTNTLDYPGSITSATWNGATVTVSRGGTGATTLTGVLKGNGTSAFTAAVAGTDYQAPITLTTTGSSGAATFVGNTLNIPIYTGGGSSGPILESQIVISQNYTLTSNTNGLSISPVTVATGYAVTVPTGQTWSILRT